MRDMYAVITGDLVDSRSSDVEVWLPILQQALHRYSKKFDIFRGDSFQAEVELSTCVEFVFYLTAKIQTVDGLGVRVGIGIGSITYADKHIKNSSGEVFIYSGKAFDELNKETINIHTPWRHWDKGINLMLQLAMELTRRWTVNMAETVASTLENPEANQHELASILNRKHQSQVSTELTKANWSKIKRVIEYVTKELLIKC